MDSLHCHGVFLGVVHLIVPLVLIFSIVLISSLLLLIGGHCLVLVGDGVQHWLGDRSVYVGVCMVAGEGGSGEWLRLDRDNFLYVIIMCSRRLMGSLGWLCCLFSAL